MECEYEYYVMYVGRLAVVQQQPLRQECEAGSIIAHYSPPNNRGTTQLETVDITVRKTAAYKILPAYIFMACIQLHFLLKYLNRYNIILYKNVHNYIQI